MNLCYYISKVFHSIVRARQSCEESLFLMFFFTYIPKTIGKLEILARRIWFQILFSTTPILVVFWKKKIYENWKKSILVIF